MRVAPLWLVTLLVTQLEAQSPCVTDSGPSTRTDAAAAFRAATISMEASKLAVVGDSALCRTLLATIAARQGPQNLQRPFSAALVVGAAEYGFVVWPQGLDGLGYVFDSTLVIRNVVITGSLHSAAPAGVRPNHRLQLTSAPARGSPASSAPASRCGT